MKEKQLFGRRKKSAPRAALAPLSRISIEVLPKRKNIKINFSLEMHPAPFPAVLPPQQLHFRVELVELRPGKFLFSQNSFIQQKTTRTKFS